MCRIGWRKGGGEVREAFAEMIANWNHMQTCGMDDAGDAADRFERTFYLFIDEVEEWFGQMSTKPKSLEEALAVPEMAAFYEQLPGPLLLNFETELELIVEGWVREEDEKYD
jgi:hypothetical protein